MLIIDIGDFESIYIVVCKIGASHFTYCLRFDSLHGYKLS